MFMKYRTLLSLHKHWAFRCILDARVPRDAQRDFDKQAEKQKADLDGDDVILCHTERVLREGLPHVRGLSVLDARLAQA